MPKSLKEEILSLIPPDKRGNIVGDELFFECPNPQHDDEVYTNCSINLKTGVFHCFACGFSGNVYLLRKIYKGLVNNSIIEDPFLGKCYQSNVRSPW